MTEITLTPPAAEVQETVLRHPERIGTAIFCAALLAVMVKFLVSLTQEHDISDFAYIVVFWGIAFLLLFSILIWSVAVSTVVRKQPGSLTISLALGRRVRWQVRYFFLNDLKDVVARERIYGFKGRKTCRYEILFGPAKEKRELLGLLTRAHVEKLASGVLRGILTIERPL